MVKKEPVIMSLGGSIFVPHAIDLSFIENFKGVIDRFAEKKKFAIVVGGGRIARNYIKATENMADVSDEDRDWIGIRATRLNAQLFQTIFKDKAHPEIVTNPEKSIDFKEKILVGAGWKPGRSSDYVAVKLAENLGVKKLINLTNQDYVYDKDPEAHWEANPIEEMKWEDFREMIGDEWNPGKHSPFDPVASKLAEKLGMEVVIANGRDLKNLKKILEGKKFKGTTIKP